MFEAAECCTTMSPTTPVVKHKFMCLTHSVRLNKLKHGSLDQRKVYCRAEQGDGWLVPPKTPNSPMAFSKALLKAK